MVGGGEHKVILDESGFSAYRVDMDWGLNFLSIKGVAGEVLDATAAWLKAHRAIYTVVLGVSAKHTAEICAYEKAGFVLEDTPLVVRLHPDQVFMVKR